MTKVPTLNACCANGWERMLWCYRSSPPPQLFTETVNLPSVCFIMSEIFIFPLMVIRTIFFHPWPLRSLLWVMVSSGLSLFLYLLTFWLMEWTSARQRDWQRRKGVLGGGGVLFDLGSRCVGLECLCVCECVSCTKLVIESHSNSARGHSFHWGVKWPGPGLDYKAGPHYDKGEKQQGPCVTAPANKLKCTGMPRARP